MELTYIFTAEVTSSQDVPGFVSNALLMPFINEVRTPPACDELRALTKSLFIRLIRPFLSAVE